MDQKIGQSNIIEHGDGKRLFAGSEGVLICSRDPRIHLPDCSNIDLFAGD
jgi:hypothetical protein